MGYTFQLLLLFISLNFNFIPSDGVEGVMLSENDRINDIDFTFEMNKNHFQFSAEFEIDANLECSENTSFDFEHKKKYTTGADDFILSGKGNDWYEVTFVIRKYFMTEVRALYLYQLDPEQNIIDFELISSQINIPSLNVVKGSKGSIVFKEMGGKTIINYTLNYFIKPTIFRRTLFKIQKKETINFLSGYKKYLQQHCHN